MFEPGTSLEQLEARVSSLEAQVNELRRTQDSHRDPPSGDAREAAGDTLIEPPNGSAPAEALPPSSGSQPSIEGWFSQRGFTVQLADEKREDRVYDNLAEYLGDNFEVLNKVVGGLRWTIREGKNTRWSLLRVGDSERRHILEFTGMLNDRALLSYYNYNESNGSLSVRASDSGPLQRFLDGFWLERYTLVKARQRIESLTTDFSYARNLILAGGGLKSRFEMDIFFLVGDTPIWIECKSRDYRQDIEKYVERAEAIGIRLDHTLLVAQTLEHDVATDLSDMFGICVTPTGELAKNVELLLKGLSPPAEGEAGGAKPAEAKPAEVEAGSLQPELSALLREAQLAPYSEIRRSVLEVLLGVVSDGLPATVRDIRERMQEGLDIEAKPAAHPVLVAVRRGGGVLTANGLPYRGTVLDTEVAALAASDVEGLDALCLNAYRDFVKRKFPGALDDAEFRAEFERVVLAS